MTSYTPPDGDAKSDDLNRSNVIFLRPTTGSKARNLEGNKQLLAIMDRCGDMSNHYALIELPKSHLRVLKNSYALMVEIAEGGPEAEAIARAYLRKRQISKRRLRRGNIALLAVQITVQPNGVAEQDLCEVFANVLEAAFDDHLSPRAFAMGVESVPECVARIRAKRRLQKKTSLSG